MQMLFKIIYRDIQQDHIKVQSVDDDIKKDSTFPRYLSLIISDCKWSYQAGFNELLVTKIKYKKPYIKKKIYLVFSMLAVLPTY